MPPDDHDDNFKSSDNLVALSSKQAEADEAGDDQGNETARAGNLRSKAARYSKSARRRCRIVAL